MTSLRRTRPRPPVRAMHLGLGNFFRAHQAWYTHAAVDGQEWGIAAFAGRRPDLAEALAVGDCLYRLEVRGPTGSAAEVVESIAEVHVASDAEAWLRLWADPAVGYVTLTVTEPAYRLDDDPSSVTSRLVAGLRARRAAGAGPIALIPCDNLPANGEVLRDVVAARTLGDPGLAAWVDANARYVSTVVDRITPANEDPLVVVTEPYTDWVIGARPGPTYPRWDTAGARFVEDVAPYEARKLFLLNGAHSLLAYCGRPLGHRLVAEAIADPRCRDWVRQWWDEARPYVAVPDLEPYVEALLLRFENPAIEHRLDQIALDGPEKLRVRVLPVLRAERAAGRMPAAAVRILAGYARSDTASIAQMLARIDPSLPDDADLVAAVTRERIGS